MIKSNKLGKYRIKKSILMLLLYIGFASFVFWIIFPFLWVFISSFMTRAELGAVPPHWIPHQLTFDNYSSVVLGRASSNWFMELLRKPKLSFQQCSEVFIFRL